MFYKLIFILFVLYSNLFSKIIENIETFEANFTQNIVNNANKKIIYTGKIYIQKPDKILWNYKTPIIKNIYINKEFIIIDEPQLEQAIFTSLKKKINIITLLKNAKEIKPNIYSASSYDRDFQITIKN